MLYPAPTVRLRGMIESVPMEHSGGFGETFADDYGAAIVHIVWERVALVFAWVELLPCEVSPPEDDGKVGTRVQKSDLYVRHVVTTADRALRWYRDCARGVVVLPTSEGLLPEPGPDVVALEMSSIDDEPRWPNLVCTRSEILPFFANWYECPRVHHLLQREFSIGALWNDTQQATARKWLVEQLHFDIGEHHALWGSVHLVAPNPVFRNLIQRLETAADQKTERLLVHVQARAGHRVEGLLLRFFEQRPTGICVSKHWILSEPTLELSFDHVLGEFAIEIHDPRRGLLWFEPPTTVISSVGIQMTLATGTRVIRPASGPAREVPLVTDMLAMSVGKPLAVARDGAQVLLAKASTLHEQRKQKQALERWFNGQQEEAIDVVHKLLEDARERAVIIDPYFLQPELRFAVGVSRVTVPIWVLTSHDVLVERESKGELQDAFVAAVERIVADPNNNRLEVRVMPGAGIHDRFLIIDARVFLLGSSLNKFGDRGTMIVELRQPAGVRDALLQELALGTPLAQWLAVRRAKQDSTSKEGGK